MIEYFVLAILAICAYIYYSLVYKPRKLYDFYANTLEGLGFNVQKLPFTPFGIPFIQKSRKDFSQHKDSYYSEKYENDNYDFTLHNIANQITIDILNPDVMKEFLSMEKIFLFPKKKVYIANMKRLLGDGVAFSENQVWKSKRKIVTSVFTFDFIKSIIPNINHICDQQLNKAQEKWKDKNPKSQEIRVFILEEAFNIFANILMVSFFGMEANKLTIEGKTPCEFITQALKLTNSQATEPLGYLLGPWIFNLGLKQRDRKVNHIIKVFRQFASKLVNQKIEMIRAENKQGKQKPKNYSDLIEALVYFYNLGSEHQNIQDKYSVDDVINEFCTLLAAATDTTSHFFMMMVYYTVETSQVEARLRKEINQVFKNETDMTYENLKKMKYIECIQEQVSRIYGPGTGIFFREATKDTQLMNIPVKKGTSLTINPRYNHYSQKYFDEPLSFKPERWQKPNNLHPYTVMNFSAGPRGCLGKHLALLQTKITLIKLFKKYKSITLEKKISEWEMDFQFLYSPQKFMTILKH